MIAIFLLDYPQFLKLFSSGLLPCTKDGCCSSRPHIPWQENFFWFVWFLSVVLFRGEKNSQKPILYDFFGAILTYINALVEREAVKPSFWHFQPLWWNTSSASSWGEKAGEWFFNQNQQSLAKILIFCHFFSFSRKFQITPSSSMSNAIKWARTLLFYQLPFL